MKMSVGTQLAIVTVSVLLLVTTLLVLGLASQERQRAIESKTAAATMVTELFARAVSAGVVFGDVDAVKATLDNLRQTEDVIGGAVFQPTSVVPFGGFGEPGAPSVSPNVEIEANRLTITRDIVDNEGKTVGATRVVFSLQRENEVLARTRRDLALGGAVATWSKILSDDVSVVVLRQSRELTEASRST